MLPFRLKTSTTAYDPDHENFSSEYLTCFWGLVTIERIDERDQYFGMLLSRSYKGKGLLMFLSQKQLEKLWAHLIQVWRANLKAEWVQDHMPPLWDDADFDNSWETEDGG